MIEFKGGQYVSFKWQKHETIDTFFRNLSFLR